MPQGPLLGHPVRGGRHTASGLPSEAFERVAVRGNGGGSDDELEDDEDDEAMTSGSEMTNLRKPTLGFDSPSTNNGSTSGSPSLRNLSASTASGTSGTSGVSSVVSGGGVGGAQTKGNRNMGPGPGRAQSNNSVSSGSGGHGQYNAEAGDGRTTMSISPHDGSQQTNIGMGPSGISRQKSGPVPGGQGSYQFLQTPNPGVHYGTGHSPTTYYRMAGEPGAPGPQQHHGMIPMEIDGRATTPNGPGPSPTAPTNVYRMTTYDHYNYGQAYGKDGLLSALRQQSQGRVDNFEWPAFVNAPPPPPPSQAQMHLQPLGQHQQHATIPLQRSQSAGGVNSKMGRNPVSQHNNSAGSTPGHETQPPQHHQRPKLKVTIPMGGSRSEGELKSDEMASEDSNDENRQPGRKKGGGGSGGGGSSSSGGGDRSGAALSAGGPNSAWGSSILLPPLSPSAYLANQNSSGGGQGVATGVQQGGGGRFFGNGGGMPSAHPSGGGVNVFGRPPFGTQANGEQTPLSAALPSKYVNDLLPSPSNFYGTEWNTSFGPPSAYGSGPGSAYQSSQASRPNVTAGGSNASADRNVSGGAGNGGNGGGGPGSGSGPGAGGGGGGGGPGSDIFPSALQFNVSSGHGETASGPGDGKNRNDKEKGPPNKKSKVD